MTWQPHYLPSESLHVSSLHQAKWAAWLAKGVAHDARVRPRVLTVLLALASVGLIGSEVLLAR